MSDITTFPQLYSLDSKGKTRIWAVAVQGNIINVTHGLEFGKLQIKQTTCKGKNIGKANETTPAEQAILEATAKHKFQIQREDYAEDRNESNKQVRPMLAHDATKVGHRVTYHDGKLLYTQPKIDGLRLTYGKRWWDRDTHHEFMSRKGDTYSVEHLHAGCDSLLDTLNNLNEIPRVSLDGELYIHGLPLQQIVSRAKKYKKGLTEELKYYLFDLVIPDMGFHDRYELLQDALFNIPDEYKDIFELVPLTHISDALPLDKVVKVLESGKKETKYNAKEGSQLHNTHRDYISQGYEGTIIRHPHSMYGIGQRSADLFKYKEFKDTEVKILEVWKDKNGNAMLTCELKNGLICKVTPKRTHAERKQMLVDAGDYIGKWITVKYFETTDDGNLQFPIGLDLRECTDNGTPIE